MQCSGKASSLTRQHVGTLLKELAEVGTRRTHTSWAEGQQTQSSEQEPLSLAQGPGVAGGREQEGRTGTGRDVGIWVLGVTGRRSIWFRINEPILIQGTVHETQSFQM